MKPRYSSEELLLSLVIDQSEKTRTIFRECNDCGCCFRCEFSWKSLRWKPR